MDELLGWMQAHGSCVALSWGEGEDGDQWECSFISGGERFTEYGPTPGMAARGAVAAMMRFVALPKEQPR